MTVGGLATKGPGLLKKPAVRIQPSDVQTAALWGVAAGATAIWIVQVHWFWRSLY